MASELEADRITQKYLRRWPDSKLAKSWAGRMVHIQTENGVWRTNGYGYTYAGKPDAWILPFEEAQKCVAHCGPEKQATFIAATPVAPVSPDATGKCGELVTGSEIIGEGATVWVRVDENKDGSQEITVTEAIGLSDVPDGEYLFVREGTRSQAEELLADATDTVKRQGKEILSLCAQVQRQGSEIVKWQGRTEKAEADNAALTARVKELRIDRAAWEAVATDIRKQAKALEAKLTAAEKELEAPTILRSKVAEYIAARDDYELATKPNGSFGTARHLKPNNPIAVRYREARAALGGKAS
ncbi:hypothetical protein [Brucella intermedia]|uniref:hypothetical protein n=1 Tax=Brucella intermedia TaxID=94625 RepID=UPI00158B908E|nr:hypothetical protein [Brucella intermedia]NYD84404.1 hypothetical protein [Brucella intermedia]